MKMKVQAQHLQPNDIVGSGEKVHCVQAGLYTPAGKIEVILSNGQHNARRAIWNKSTIINVERKE